MNCPEGEYYRKSYTRKGVRIAGKCLRSQTRYASKTKVNHTRFRGFRKTKRALSACPKGYIRRASYVRYTKSGKHTLVPEQCIPDMGAPGKGYSNGPGIGTLRKGELAKHGYSKVSTLSMGARHAALDKAIKEFGSLGVWRKLNAVYVYTRRTAPEASKIFKADRDWIRVTYGIKAF
jgi:hypothetical protein